MNTFIFNYNPNISGGQIYHKIIQMLMIIQDLTITLDSNGHVTTQ